MKNDIEKSYNELLALIERNCDPQTLLILKQIEDINSLTSLIKEIKEFDYNFEIYVDSNTELARSSTS